MSAINIGNQSLLKARQGEFKSKLQKITAGIKNKDKLESMSEFDKKRLKEACFDLESLFLNQLMKSMRKNMPEGGIFKKSNAEKIFEDMLYEDYSNKSVRSQTNGLAIQMYNQMIR